jgi:5-methylthioadenosine/S-adenosylhomocysteine deaminase
MKTYIHPEDIYLFGMAACIEAIHGGSTTLIESYNYIDHFAKAVQETGLRAVLGEQIIEADLTKIKNNVYDYNPDQAEKSLRDTKDLIKKWQNSTEDRIKTIVSPLALDMTTAETFIKCKEIADEHHLDITTHLSQSWGEVLQVKKIYGKTPCEKLADLKILNSRFSGAHCYYLTEKERMLMAESSAKILHCPRPYTLERFHF